VSPFMRRATSSAAASASPQAPSSSRCISSHIRTGSRWRPSARAFRVGANHGAATGTDMAQRATRTGERAPVTGREGGRKTPDALSLPTEHTHLVKNRQKILFFCVRPCNILQFNGGWASISRTPDPQRGDDRAAKTDKSGPLKARERGMPDFSTLTERQREIYNFIRSKIESRGYGPTVREIGLAFDIKSPNGVMCHLKALEKKGLIHREGFSARAIQLIDHPLASPAELPLLGKVAAGAPIAAVENLEERLNLGDLFVGDGHFALKVRGQSMIEDHIDDGDYVIIKQQETASNGERVVAMIEGE